MVETSVNDVGSPWVMRESSTMRVGVRRGASLDLLEGKCQSCGNEGGRGRVWRQDKRQGCAEG